MADQRTVVTGGVDTHKDFHVAAVIDSTGKILDTEEFPATKRGYRELIAWMSSFGSISKIGVEGTGAYGAGLARSLADEGINVVEVDRPNRRMRRLHGKSDVVDAKAAARAALGGEASVTPKSREGVVESIRVLRIAYCSARDSRTRIANQIRDLILTAPEELRSSLDPLSTEARVKRCVHLRTGDLADPAQATRAALRSLASRYQALTNELCRLRASLDELTTEANPALRQVIGVGGDVAALLLIAAGDNPERLHSESAFAAMCGVCPIEASSGQIVRHRLNRGGNRSANHAIWRIAMVRMTCDQRTKDYVDRRRAEGKTNREIIRCLKRYIAREIHRVLTNPQPVEIQGSDLRAARQAAGLTQEEVAAALNTKSPRISNIECGRGANYELTARYRDWLESLNSTCAA